MKDIRALLGERLRGLRTAKNWSLEEFAHVAKMDRIFVGGLERGVRSASIDSIGKLALALDVKPSELLDFGQRLPRTKVSAPDALGKKVAVLAQEASPWELKKFERLAETFFEEHHPRRKRT